MMKITTEICNKLFNIHFAELKDEDKDELDKLANEVLRDNDWNEVFGLFNSYMRNECKSENEIINYVYLFLRYVGLNFTIPSDYDVYDLVGYILAKVDLEKRWDDCGDIFDDFANEALKIDLMKDPYYQFWRDPKVLAAAKKYEGN